MHLEESVVLSAKSNDAVTKRVKKEAPNLKTLYCT